jgi:hypothetical protein
MPPVMDDNYIHSKDTEIMTRTAAVSFGDLRKDYKIDKA